MWSTVGSTGTVDLADVGKVIFAGSIVQIPGVSSTGVRNAHRESGAASHEAVVFPLTTARIRYDVTPDAGVNRFLLTLKLLFRGGSGQVVAKLVQVAIPQVGVYEVPEPAVTETTLLTFDSAAQDPSGEFQAREVTFLPTDPGKLDFTNNAYYIELSLIAREGPVVLINPPAVATIQLFEAEHQ
ncbi:MAG: hypothetical protein ABSF98_01830 [Bryobacteraceae bacterium]